MTKTDVHTKMRRAVMRWFPPRNASDRCLPLASKRLVFAGVNDLFPVWLSLASPVCLISPPVCNELGE
jgi:hypothetical protein